MANVDVSSKFHEASSHPNEGPPFLEDADGKFERYWNRASFRFSHKLSGHPLFELDSLVELSRRMPKCADFAYWSNGTEGPGNQWGTRLGAGDGVPVPVHAPHWAQNGDNISVALSVNYELRSEYHKSDLYQLQHWGRRAGLKPHGPERAGLAWKAAAVALRTARGLRKLIRPSDDGVPTRWQPS